MPEIKLTIDGTDYELIEKGLCYGADYIHLIHDHKAYYGKAIQKANDVPIKKELSKVKPKVPLFTTEDGVLVYDQDEYYYMRNWNYGKCRAFPNCLYGDKEGAMYFSSAEKAKEYILLNRPVQVSYNELQEFFMNNYNVHTLDSTSLKEFFKSKINP